MSVKQATPKRVRVDGVPNLYQRPADGRYEVGYTGSDGKWHIKTLRRHDAHRREEGAAPAPREARPQRRCRAAEPHTQRCCRPALRGVREQGLARRAERAHARDLPPAVGHAHPPHFRTQTSPGHRRRRDVSRFLAELRRKTNPRAKSAKPTGAALELDGTRRAQRAQRCGGARRHARVRGEQPGAETERREASGEEQVEGAHLGGGGGRAADRARAGGVPHPDFHGGVHGHEAVGASRTPLGRRGLRGRDDPRAASALAGDKEQPARVVPLKTDAAERHIDLAPELSRELAKHRLASSFSKPEDFVFATETGNPVYYRNASARGLDKAADRAGLNPEGAQRLSFHDLRHTAITHLIRSGADAAQVSRFAGHSKVSTTLDLYVGEFEKRKVNDSGQRLAAVYAGAV